MPSSPSRNLYRSNSDFIDEIVTFTFLHLEKCHRNILSHLKVTYPVLANKLHPLQLSKNYKKKRMHVFSALTILKKTRKPEHELFCYHSFFALKFVIDAANLSLIIPFNKLFNVQ